MNSNKNYFKGLLYLSIQLLIVSLGLGELSISNIKLNSIFFGIYLILFTFYILLYFREIKLIKHKIWITSFILFFLIYAISISILNTFDNFEVNTLITILISLIIVASLIVIVNDINDLIKISHGIVIGLIINILLGIYNIYTGLHFIDVDPAHLRFGSNFPLGFFGNPNDYASHIFISISIVFLLSILKRKFNIYTIILIGISLYLINKTGSRANIYASILFAFIYIFVTLFMNQIIKFRKIILAVIVFLGVFLIIIISLNYDSFTNFYLNNFTDNENYISDFLRLNLIKDAIDNSINYFGLGIGAGNSTKISNLNLHNFYLEILVEYGVINLIIVAYLIFSPIFIGKSRRINKFLYSFFLAYPFAFSIMSASSSSILKNKVMWISIIIIYMVFIYSKKGIKSVNNKNYYNKERNVHI